MPTEQRHPVIEVADLTIPYKKFIAVRGVHFTVQEGEVFGLLGHNGAGKTSIIKVLTTLKRDWQGSVRIGGVDARRHPNRVRKNICLVSQQNSLDIFLNVYDNLYFSAWLQHVPRSRRRGQVLELLDFFGLSQKRRQMVTTLSGGEYRRLQLAKMFLSSARVYFLDEPSLGIDYQAREIFWKYLRDTCKQTGNTIILATNDLLEAERMCDRIAFINQGMIVALDTPGELERRMNKVMVDVQFAGAVERLNGSTFTNATIEDLSGSLIRFRYWGNGASLTPFIQDLERHGTVRSLHMRQPDLHDVFLALMKPKEGSPR